MHEYGDHDNSTPESLLDDTVAYARVILEDLKQAKITPDKRNAAVQQIGVHCLSDEADDYVRNMFKKNGYLIIEREEYGTSHPAIVHSFQSVLDKLMGEAGLVKTDPGKPYTEYKDGDFSHGGSISSTSIISIHLAGVTSPKKMSDALMVDDDKLRRLCKEALEENFAMMAAFGAGLKKNVPDQIPGRKPGKTRPSGPGR